MKIPTRIQIEIERLARLIAAGAISWDEAIDELEPFLEKTEYKLFVSWLHRRYLRSQIKNAIAALAGATGDDEEEGQQALPFPDLPAWIEIAPALKRHQNAMNLKDWDAAVVQAETKATNAQGHLERVRRARDRARELLHGDETLGEATG